MPTPLGPPTHPQPQQPQPQPRVQTQVPLKTSSSVEMDVRVPIEPLASSPSPSPPPLSTPTLHPRTVAPGAATGAGAEPHARLDGGHRRRGLGGDDGGRCLRGGGRLGEGCAMCNMIGT